MDTSRKDISRREKQQLLKVSFAFNDQLQARPKLVVGRNLIFMSSATVSENLLGWINSCKDKQMQIIAWVKALQFDSFDPLVLKCPDWMACLAAVVAGTMLDLSPGEILSIHSVSFGNSTITASMNTIIQSNIIRSAIFPFYFLLQCQNSTISFSWKLFS